MNADDSMALVPKDNKENAADAERASEGGVDKRDAAKVRITFEGAQTEETTKDQKIGKRSRRFTYDPKGRGYEPNSDINSDDDNESSVSTDELRARFSRHGFKLPQPARFTGTAKETDNLNNWIREVTDYLEFNQLVGKMGILALGALLGGGAHTWYYAHREDYKQPAELLAALREAFGHQDLQSEAMNSLFRLKGRERNIAEYNRRFRELLMIIQDISESTKLHVYLQGLPVQLQTALIQLERPTSLDEAMRRAERIDKTWTTTERQARNMNNSQPRENRKNNYNYNQSGSAYQMEGQSRGGFNRGRGGRPTRGAHNNNNNNNRPRDDFCYVCASTDHRSWQCPLRKTAPTTRGLNLTEREFEGEEFDYDCLPEKEHTL